MLSSRAVGMMLFANGTHVRAVPDTLHWVGSTMTFTPWPVVALRAPGPLASSCEKSPARIAAEGTLYSVWNCLRSLYPSQFDMKNSLFLHIGPPAVYPYWFHLNGALGATA